MTFSLIDNSLGKHFLITLSKIISNFAHSESTTISFLLVCLLLTKKTNFEPTLKKFYNQSGAISSLRKKCHYLELRPNEHLLDFKNLFVELACAT